VRGASLVVWAIRDGREAAESILDWLAGRSARLAAE
jgi:glutamate synthase (NADPH/NADH) small chain